MPARRNRRKNKERRESKSKVWPLILLLLVTAISIFIYKSAAASKIGDSKRVSVAVNTQSEVLVTNYDFELEEVTTVVIPASAQVAAARGLGSWRIGSLWQLGVDEGVGGVLLAETLTRDYKFPTFLWANEPARGFAEGRDLWSAVFANYDTNLTFFDKVRLAIFSSKIKNTNRTTIDLVEKRYLVAAKLPDGGESYVKNGEFSAGLTSIFSDPDIANANFNLKLVDASGSGVVNSFGAVLEVVGLKIGAVEKAKPDETNCTLRSQERAVFWLRELFDCNLEKTDPGNGYQVEIVVGEGFADRY